jgi:hypothetical protein
MAKKKAAERSTKKTNKAVQPTGIDEVDGLVALDDSACSIQAYVAAASEYVRRSGELSAGPKKAAQIRLSAALGRALERDLKAKLPNIGKVVVGERKVAGALRTVNADVSEIDDLDGLRLAIELKPINLAVGRAIWNRFGDIRTFAVNLHLKFPFCVVGGVLAIPTYEAAASPQEIEAALAEGGEDAADNPLESDGQVPLVSGRRSTVHLINRAIANLRRAGGRKREGDAPHLLEGVAVVVYDPDAGVLHSSLPSIGSGLRWDEFINDLSDAYLNRFDV